MIAICQSKSKESSIMNIGNIKLALQPLDEQQIATYFDDKACQN